MCASPDPGVTIPDGGEDMDGSRVWTAVDDRVATQDIVGGFLTVLGVHVEETVFIEHACKKNSSPHDKQ